MKWVSCVMCTYFWKCADISMQDLLVIYDNERGRIGWARANCNKNNKLK